jgi:uncharacterized protein (TIGR02646 family)
MLAIPLITCSTSAIQKLAFLQSEVDTLESHLLKTQKAEAHWENRTKNQEFRVIKDELLKVCPGGYCCYCETNEPSPVEHIWPKVHYPERSFRWENYLFACANCNSIHKRSRWAIFQNQAGIDYWEEASWSAKPPAGDPVFLDLRQEDPQSLIRLDFETFRFEADVEDPRQQERVDYTINKVLKLNERGLSSARSAMYDAFLYRLNLLRSLSPVDRQNKSAKFNGVPQRTVWKEMQRWHQRIPELKRLFEAVPEALDW